MRSEELAYFEEKEFKEALAQYESALNEGRQIYMDADDLTDIAEYYMVKEREHDAMQCINLAVELHPEAIDPQVFLSRREMFHDNMESAKRIARNIREQDDREVQFLWAEIFIKEGKSQEASERLMKYYKTLHEERDFFLYDAAGVFMDYDEWGIAEKWAQMLKEKFPHFERADILLSDIMVSCGKCEKAVPILNSILDRDSFNLEAWCMLAEAQSALEHYTEALEAIEYLLAIDEKHMQGQLIRANCLFHLHRMDEAHEQYSKYLETNPNEIAVLYFDAVTLTNLGQYGYAMGRLDKALLQCNFDTPERPSIYIQYCYLYSKLRNYDKAIWALDEAYRTGNRMIDSDYYMLMGHICLENNVEDNVDDYFIKSIEMSDTPDATKLIVGIEYAECEKHDKAVKIFEEIMSDKCKMNEKEEQCLPYLAFSAYHIDHPRFREYLFKAIDCNRSLTIYLFSSLSEREIAKLNLPT